MSESMREDFEAWLDSAGFKVRRYHHIDGYNGNEQMAAWEAWQASRAALCVELPVVADYIDLHLQSMNAKIYNEALTEAIHAAGVKTK